MIEKRDETGNSFRVNHETVIAGELFEEIQKKWAIPFQFITISSGGKVDDVWGLRVTKETLDQEFDLEGQLTVQPRVSLWDIQQAIAKQNSPLSNDPWRVEIGISVQSGQTLVTLRRI